MLTLVRVTCRSPLVPLTNLTDAAAMDIDLQADSGATSFALYTETKFAQLLSAHWWRRQLADSCKVLTVSPGLIPGTGLGRGSGMTISMDTPDAKPMSEGE
jgi:NAD(P)-dependent dehydrogenase (short-subunit alcohol dehydrogenase family)